MWLKFVIPFLGVSTPAVGSEQPWGTAASSGEEQAAEDGVSGEQFKRDALPRGE